VRLERASEPGAWRVLAGAADDPIVVGFLEPVSSVGRRAKRWSARPATSFTAVFGGPWPTRKAALVHLLDYQRRA